MRNAAVRWFLAALIVVGYFIITDNRQMTPVLECNVAILAVGAGVVGWLLSKNSGLLLSAIPLALAALLWLALRLCGLGASLDFRFSPLHPTWQTVWSILQCIFFGVLLWLVFNVQHKLCSSVHDKVDEPSE